MGQKNANRLSVCPSNSVLLILIFLHVLKLNFGMGVRTPDPSTMVDHRPRRHTVPNTRRCCTHAGGWPTLVRFACESLCFVLLSCGTYQARTKSSRLETLGHPGTQRSRNITILTQSQTSSGRPRTCWSRPGSVLTTLLDWID